MLDQDADEALVRPEDRAVEHDRAMAGAILADIAGVEPLRQHAVGLDRADLPGPADRVGEVPFELGRIEGAFARQLFPAKFFRGETRAGHRVAQLGFCLVPHLLVPKRLSGRSASLIA
jgi:hypothetical protein